MSYLNQYKRRMKANAGLSKDEINSGSPVTLREAQLNRATESQRRTFFDSPTLIPIDYEDVPIYSIKSDKYKDIEIQTFLFEPEFDAQIGSLIYDGEHRYLAVAKNGDKIYPELLTQICNDTFDIPTDVDIREIVDRFGNIKYIETPITETIYVSLTDKDYSISNNSLLPLPSGRINIEMQYKLEYLEFFHINYKFEHSGGDYKVTDIRKVSKTPTEHYLKVSATRVVSDYES